MKKLLLGLLLFVSCMLSAFTSSAATIVFHPSGSGRDGGANAPGWWMESYPSDGVHYWMHYSPPSAGGSAEVYSIYYQVWHFAPGFIPPIYYRKAGGTMSTAGFSNGQNAVSIGECPNWAGRVWSIIPVVSPYTQYYMYGDQIEYIVRITLNSPYSGTAPAPMPVNNNGGVAGGFGFIEGVSYNKLTGNINGSTLIAPEAGTKVFDVSVCVSEFGVDTFTVVAQWKPGEAVPPLSANYLPEGNPGPYSWGLTPWP